MIFSWPDGVLKFAQKYKLSYWFLLLNQYNGNDKSNNREVAAIAAPGLNRSASQPISRASKPEKTDFTFELVESREA